ncbi:hypothetical protein A464_1728 [Salmonella bongori N268-08]|uniref:Uncharacterized protein n=1 Tax=Salmonella bongori N268-08 TaxID=1197719 RepID=S5MW75_SALBN|nr:hypothetical protein A464_1728 [Salmonella bongori N268-08]
MPLFSLTSHSRIFLCGKFDRMLLTRRRISRSEDSHDSI